MSIGEVSAWKQAMLQHLPLTDGEFAYINERRSLPKKPSERQIDVHRICCVMQNFFDKPHWIIKENPSFSDIYPLPLKPFAAALLHVENHQAREILHALFRRHVITFSRWLCGNVKITLEQHREKIAASKNCFIKVRFCNEETRIHELYKHVGNLQNFKECVVSHADIVNETNRFIVFLFKMLALTRTSPYVFVEDIETVKEKLPIFCGTLDSSASFVFDEFSEVSIELKNFSLFLIKDLSFPRKYKKEAMISLKKFSELFKLAIRSGTFQEKDPLNRYEIIQILEDVQAINATAEENIYKRLSIPIDIVKKLQELQASVPKSLEKESSDEC